MIVEFQHAFRLKDGLTDYDIVAIVNLTSRTADVKRATVTATQRPARLTRERRAAAEARAIEVADELTDGDWP